MISKEISGRRLDKKTINFTYPAGKADPYTFVCEWCGSEEVNQSAWVNVNTEKLVDFVDESSFWCEDCNEEVNINTFEEWEEYVAEYCNGNKDTYEFIIEGGRR